MSACIQKNAAETLTGVLAFLRDIGIMIHEANDGTYGFHVHDQTGCHASEAITNIPTLDEAIKQGVYARMTSLVSAAMEPYEVLLQELESAGLVIDMTCSSAAPYAVQVGSWRRSGYWTEAAALRAGLRQLLKHPAATDQGITATA